MSLTTDPIKERRNVPGRRESDNWAVWDRRVRDIGIYIVALTGTINQLFFAKDPSETALVFLAAMLGFPLVLRADEARRSPNQEMESRGDGAKTKESS